MPHPYLFLGPPPEDTEEAAQLLVRYHREGGLSPEGGEMFAKMCADSYAVIVRAEEILAAEEGREPVSFRFT